MDISSIIFIVVGAVDLLAGLASIITGKVYMMSSANQYTDESLAKFSRPQGIAQVMFGLGLILSEVIQTEVFNISGVPIKAGWLILVVMLILGAIVYIASRKVLVKK